MGRHARTVGGGVTRRGQIQFGESLMVVIILVFIMIIGMVFYFSVSRGSIQEELSYQEDIGAVTLAKNVLALPEVSCGRFAARGPTCIDELKLRALAGILSETNPDTQDIRNYYGDLFGSATIKVHILDLEAGTSEVVPLYSHRPATNLTESRQFIFSTIYDPVKDRQRLAYPNVTRYTRGAS